MIHKDPAEKWTHEGPVTLGNLDMGDNEKREKIDMTESWIVSDRKTVLFVRDF